MSPAGQILLSKPPIRVLIKLNPVITLDIKEKLRPEW